MIRESGGDSRNSLIGHFRYTRSLRREINDMMESQQSEEEIKPQLSLIIKGSYISPPIFHCCIFPIRPQSASWTGLVELCSHELFIDI